jgi:hypothetical protein
MTKEKPHKLDDDNEAVERGKRMTPEELARRMLEHNKKKKEGREQEAK